MLIPSNKLYEHCMMIIFFFSQDPLLASVPMDLTGLVACFRSRSLV